MLVIADVVAGPSFELFGVLAGVVAVLAIGVAEALVLWQFGWGSIWRSLRDSVIVNVGSALVGLVLNMLGSEQWQACGYDPARGGYWCEWLISPWLLFGAAWLLSVLIEGGLLMLLSKYPRRSIWLAALLMNTVSYAVIGGLLLASAMAAG